MASNANLEWLRTMPSSWGTTRGATISSRWREDLRRSSQERWATISCSRDRNFEFRMERRIVGVFLILAIGSALTRFNVLLAFYCDRASRVIARRNKNKISLFELLDGRQIVCELTLAHFARTSRIARNLSRAIIESFLDCTLPGKLILAKEIEEGTFGLKNSKERGLKKTILLGKVI